MILKDLFATQKQREEGRAEARRPIWSCRRNAGEKDERSKVTVLKVVGRGQILDM